MVIQPVICIFIIVSLVSGEQYNLVGDAGQAYSLEITIGKPKQKLKVIVDTGSTTLAIASYSRGENDTFFHIYNSTSFVDSGKEVQARYSQGMWVGHLASDYITVPSLLNVPLVKSDFAVITKSHKFFMNGSGWQGLLGLAYLPVGAWGEDIVVGSWLDSVESIMSNRTAFSLELCGPQGLTNATHYGKFSMFVKNGKYSKSTKYRTPILHKRWYEVGVLAINVLHIDLLPSNGTNNTKSYDKPPDTNMCKKLNTEKSIVDSGTTNIRLPDDIFKQVVTSVSKLAQSCDISLLDEFWFSGEAACWPEPQDWSTMPWLAIDLLSSTDVRSYFTLHIPPQNYMRVISAHNHSDGSMSQYCYKLGLEAGGKDTVLGYTAMEGLKLTFNRSGGWIEWDITECGPNSFITGPYYVTQSLVKECDLNRNDHLVAPSIRAAQWALLAIFVIAGGIFMYLLLPCLKILFLKPMSRSRGSSIRHALFDQESDLN